MKTMQPVWKQQNLKDELTTHHRFHTGCIVSKMYIRLDQSTGVS